MNTTLRTQMTTPTRSSQLTIYSSRRHLIQELDFDLSFRGNLPLTDLSKADFEGCPLLAQSGQDGWAKGLLRARSGSWQRQQLHD